MTERVLNIRNVHHDDLDDCYAIEQIAYAGEEAASKEKIERRIQQYAEGFVVGELNGQVIGFINSGATDHVRLSDEAFKELVGHDSAGRQIVIMSVVVHPDFQGHGYACQLLTHFIAEMKRLKKQSILLICQQELIGFYQQFGFRLLGESSSDHGGLSWHEMQLDLQPSY